MADDFLDQARRNWRAQDAEIEDVGRRLRRSLAVSRAVQAAELGGTVLAVVVGVAYGWLGLAQHEMALIVGGVVLGLGAPLLTWAAWRVRREEPRWQDEEPNGVLRQMLRQVATTERLMAVTRWHGWVLIATTLVLWALVAVGRVRADLALGVISAAFLAAAAGTFVWTRWREAGLRRERERCERLLEEFGGA